MDPWILTKILAYPLAFLRLEGISLISYLDNILIYGPRLGLVSQSLDSHFSAFVSGLDYQHRKIYSFFQSVYCLPGLLDRLRIQEVVPDAGKDLKTFT